MKTKKISITTILILFFTINASSQNRNRILENWRNNTQRENFFGARDNDRNSRLRNSARFSISDSVRQESLFTEEQQVQIDELRTQRNDELKPLNDELRELKAHHITLTTAEEPDLEAIYESIDKIKKIEASIEKIQVKYQQDIRSLLTEEQLQRYRNRGRMMSNRIFE